MQLPVFRGLLLSCALSASALAQGGPVVQPMGHAPKPGSTTALPASAASVAPTDAVITLDGACKSPSDGCVASVSRQQFEELANALRPDMTSDQRRAFAQQYARILLFANQARVLGLENEPAFKQLLKFATNQILVEVLNKHYSEEFSHPSDQQIQDYYNQNSQKYIEASLQRIIIPSEPAAAEVKKPTPEEQKAYVEKVRQQWVGGADPATLQSDAVKRMGLSSSPDVNLNNQRPGMLPPDQENVFNLKAGEISQPFTDTAASYIYKVVSVKQIPLSDVRAQIAKTIHDQKMRDTVQQLTENIKPVLNDAYFGPQKPPAMPGAPGQDQPTAPGSAPNGPAPSPK